MNLRGTVSFSLVLNIADRTHFASHAYGAQSEYEATGINLDYNWLLKDIW
ncbi:MAG: hypothetical protein K6E12_08050 [Saccharofermentans sp.]|nr:hypothetical protein [Saccharofermentans sp.]